MYLISFIVPVYNVEPYLEVCIKSLLMQTEKDIEIILVDDGSSDNSWRICKEYAQKHENVTAIHQENAGVSVARNRGIDVAAGVWLVFIDSDDWVALNFGELCLAALDDTVDILFFEHKEVATHDQPIRYEMAQRASPIMFTQDDFALFIKGGFNRDLPCKYDFHEIKLATPVKVYRREFVINHGIRFPAGLKTGEDLLFNLQLFCVAKHGRYIPKQIYYHRVWKGSASRSFSKTAPTDYLLLMQRLEKFISDVDRQDLVYDFHNKAIVSLGFTVLLYFCHKNNPEPYRRRRQGFREYCELSIYKEARRCALGNQFRFKKKLLYIFLKYKLFFLLDILVKTGMAK